MKKFFLILLILIVIPTTMAAEITLNDVRGYLKNNDGSYSEINDIEASNGGEMSVYPGNRIRFEIVTENNDGSLDYYMNTSMLIKDIDEYDDVFISLHDENNEYDLIEAGDRITQIINIRIPTNAEEGTYTASLFIDALYANQTDKYSSIKRKYYINVLKDATEESTSTSTTPTVYSTSYYLNNMSVACSAFMASTDACFGYVEKSKTCADELSTVKEERGSCKSDLNNCNDNLVSANNEKQSVENQNMNLQNQLNSMMTYESCNNQTASAVNAARNDASSKNNTTIIIILIIAVGAYFWDKKRKEKANVTSSFGADTGYFEK